MLLFAIAIVAGALHAAGSAGDWHGMAVAALIGVSGGGAAYRLANARLSHHREVTAFAAIALASRPARYYAMLVCGGFLVSTLIAATCIGVRTIPSAMAGFGAGVLVSAVAKFASRPGVKDRFAIPRFRSIGSPSMRTAATVAAALVSAVAAVGMAAALVRIPAVAVMAAAALPGLAMVARLDAEAVGFLAIAGEATSGALRRHLMQPALFSLAYGAALLVGYGAQGLAAAIGVGAAAMAFVAIRLLCYRSMRKPAADRLALVLLAGAAALAALLPPAVPVYLAIVLYRLWQHGKAARWRIA